MCRGEGFQVPMDCLHGEEARVACDDQKWILRGTCSLPWTLELCFLWLSTTIVESDLTRCSEWIVYWSFTAVGVPLASILFYTKPCPSLKSIIVQSNGCCSLFKRRNPVTGLHKYRTCNIKTSKPRYTAHVRIRTTQRYQTIKCILFTRKDKL